VLCSLNLVSAQNQRASFGFSELLHAQLVTPKRRSARVPAPAAAACAGALLAATGFAYTPNAALERRIGPAAAAGKLVLGDAQDEGVRGAMEEVRH
jgi:hypothetical protein